MLKQIKQYFKTYNDIANAVDYLSNYIKYHLMNNEINSKNSPFNVFRREQLKFLVSCKTIGLNNKQTNKVINLALKNVISTTKVNFITTNSAIYIAIL